MTITKSGELASFYTVNKAPIKHLRVYFSPKQEGSGDPSPENVREISGWNNIAVARTGKNVADFHRTTYGPITTQWVNGSGQWWTRSRDLQMTDYIKDIPFTFSANFDATNATGTHNNAVKVWGKKDDDTWGWLGREGNNIAKGTSGLSQITLTNTNQHAVEWGMTLEIGAIASNPMVELGTTATEYEPYHGDTLIYKFPSLTKNLFNKNGEFETINKRPYLQFIDTEETCNMSFTVKDANVDISGLYLGFAYDTSNIENGYRWVIQNGSIQSNKSNISLSGGKVCKYITYYPVNQTTLDTLCSAFDIQVEKGTTANTYEQYDDVVYGGYVDLITGELYQEWKKIIIDESYFTSVESGDTSARRVQYRSNTDLFSEDPWSDSNGQQKICLMNYIKNSIQTSIPWTGYFYGRTLNLRVDGNLITSKDDWLDYLTEHNLELVYKLATPIVHQLTSTQLKTFVGQNNIWSNVDRVEVEYDLAESNDELYRRRNIILQGAPHLATSTGSIANFNTDLAALLKECKISFSPIQEGSGDPSPENVRNIQGFTSLDLYKTGKNLIDTSALTGTTSVWWKGKIVQGYTNHCVTPKIPVCPGQTYTINRNSASQSYINLFDRNGNYIDQITQDQYSFSRTYGDDVYYVGITIGTEYLTNPYPQLELGSQQTSYEPYNGQTIPITFPALGKNLLNPATLEQGGIAWNGYDFIASNRIRTGFIPVKAGEKYTVSATGFIAFMHFYDAEKGNIGENVGGVNITAPEDAKFVRCGFRKSDDADIVPSNITDGQLEEGSTATSYEPYTNTIYGGYIDLLKGTFTRDWLINTHEIAATDGTPGGAGTGNNTDYRFIAWNLASAHLPDSDRTDQAICNIAPYSKQVGGSRFWLGGGTVYMVLPNDNQAHSVVIAYAERTLNTTTYQLTPQQLTALKGVNNIWSNANGPVSIKYWTH